MWFHSLWYPRRQIYAIPYISELFYIGSVIILAILIVVNIALVGNDVVTELKDTPNFVDTKWWAPNWAPEKMKIPTTPGPCQPLTLPQQSTSIRTNSTLPIFTYTLTNGLGTSRNANGEEEPKWYDAPHYRAEPLQNCIVQNITALFNLQDHGHKLKSQIVCNIDSTDPETPRSLKLSATFSRVANTDLGSDDVVSHITSYTVPRSTSIGQAQTVLLAQNVTVLKILGVLDAIGSDLLKAMWAQKWHWKLTGRDEQRPDQAVVKWAAKANCTNRKKCRELGEGIEGIDLWYSNTRGSRDFDPDYFTPMNTTVYNYFIAFRDALYLDLGHFDDSANIFLNTDVFMAHIIPDRFLETVASDVINVTRPPPATRPYSAHEFWRTCTWGWGCLNGTWTDALLNGNPATLNITNGLPLNSLRSEYPTIIDLKYVCPVFRRKQTGALLASVFVGTFSMYAVLCGIFWLFSPILDQKYRRRRGLREIPYDIEEEYDFDAHHTKYNNTAPIQEYIPPPDYIFVRSPRKGDELPPGACSPGAPGVFTPKPDARTLPSGSRSSQPSLNLTVSRDTANSIAAVRSSGEKGQQTISPPRVLIQSNRGYSSSRTSRKSHFAEHG